MRRDLILYLAGVALLLAAFAVAAPFITRLLNPIIYTLPANPDAPVPQLPFPTAITNTVPSTGVISPTNQISPTNTISPSNTISPTATVAPTLAPTSVIPTAIISPTETVSATAVISSATATPPPSNTPFTAPPPANAVVIATGLINPRGFTLGPDGAYYVAEAGTVPAKVEFNTTISGTITISPTNVISPTTASAQPTASADPTVNPICESQLPGYDKLAAGCPGAQGPQISSNGRISRIARDGTRTTVAQNLPTTVGPFNDVFGVNSVAFVGDTLYTIIAAGPTRGHPDFPTGVYRVAAGKTTLVANLEQFQKDNPPKFIPPDYNFSLPYDMVALDDKLYITDGNAAVVFEVNPGQPLGSNITRIIDLSPTHNVLTGIAATPDGTLYFTDFTPAPYPIGGAQIFKWSATAGLSTVTDGLSIATGIALAPDGTMYASEFAQDLTTAPYIIPPGRIVRITPAGQVFTVATPLVYPTALRWFNGALYVTNYGVDAIDGQVGNGAIYKITP